MSLKLEQVLGSGAVDKDPIGADWKLIGFFDSPETNAKLTLMAAALGLDKSKLLRKIIGDWLSENDALQVASSKVKELLSSPEGRSIPINEFKLKIKAFLEEKKVPQDLIENVLKSL